MSVRPARADELPRLQALARSEAVAPFLATIAPEQLRAGMEADDVEVLVAEVDGRFAGGARLVVANARHRIHEVATVMLDPAVRGRGLGAALLRALAARAFAAGAHRVQGEVLGHNEAALRAFDAAGFTREGVRRGAWLRDGWQDGVHVGLLAEEFANR